MKLRNMFVEFDHEHVLHIVVAHTFQEREISGIKGVQGICFIVSLEERRTEDIFSWCLPKSQKNNNNNNKWSLIV